MKKSCYKFSYQKLVYNNHLKLNKHNIIVSQTRNIQNNTSIIFHNLFNLSQSPTQDT